MFPFGMSSISLSNIIFVVEIHCLFLIHTYLFPILFHLFTTKCLFFLVVQLDATGRPDESLAVEVLQPLEPGSEENLQNGKLFSFSLQKGQLRANICLRPLHSATLEVY